MLRRKFGTNFKTSNLQPHKHQKFTNEAKKEVWEETETNHNSSHFEHQQFNNVWICKWKCWQRASDRATTWWNCLNVWLEAKEEKEEEEGLSFSFELSLWNDTHTVLNCTINSFHFIIGDIYTISWVICWWRKPLHLHYFWNHFDCEDKNARLPSEANKSLNYSNTLSSTIMHSINIILLLIYYCFFSLLCIAHCVLYM